MKIYVSEKGRRNSTGNRVKYFFFPITFISCENHIHLNAENVHFILSVLSILVYVQYKGDIE